MPKNIKKIEHCIDVIKNFLDEVLEYAGESEGSLALGTIERMQNTITELEFHLEDL